MCVCVCVFVYVCVCMYVCIYICIGSFGLVESGEMDTDGTGCGPGTESQRRTIP